MNKLYFITGSQDLYGDDVLNKVMYDSKEIAKYFQKHLKQYVDIVWVPVVKNSDEIYQSMIKVMSDHECVGVIAWMHTFSPAKMWIKGLKILTKPLIHVHTQFKIKLPYQKIDMDYMNLHQSAHGDREFGYICTRLGIHRDIVVGHYTETRVINQLIRFAEIAIAIEFSKSLKVAMIGGNMRDVAVTDGDRVESEIRYGWNINYYGIGDLISFFDLITQTDINGKLEEYKNKYIFDTKDLCSIVEQAKYEIALERFMLREKVKAFTDTFQDLHGLKQLPGLAVQNIMAKGIGFGPEGDYKTSALMAVLCKMASNRQGATAFIENYTYDLMLGNELELASHMLEVSPVFASSKPRIEVHPLSIGAKEAPARLVFSGIEGNAIAVTMVDMGTHFRIICSKIILVKQPHHMPKLPVASLMWKVLPDFHNGVAAWIYAGGSHHSVVSTALQVEDIILYAKLTSTELILIDESTTLVNFEKEINKKYYR